ncbi:MAG: Peptidoglycan/LPS O-acetylase OafA/YrhL, contains acyltransferase and SGNH-hydrolase domain [Pseudarthrobacter sp.]|nr:Peptidoglycan/LPS O-acetylase OafA/YrhL, contains acyltransferase and SGNH-hydrolase domain [Pseudarthrobacter sp.]
MGVDVFFVISGYLITALLIREMTLKGRISFSAFYARRLKRILPAAMVVLIATVLAGYQLWYLPRAHQTLLDALASMLFVQNWHLIQVGADYLQASTSPSPLQHYWSLSIEEQFYAGWPAALFTILWLCPARSWKVWLTAIIGGALVLSLAWSAYRTGTAPLAAYFDTFGRGWELLAGAAVAAVGTMRTLPRRMRSVVSLGGLVLVVGSAFLITRASDFPFACALLPVIGTAAVLVADPGSTLLTTPLTNRVSQYLGKISYSLYLWHFPTFIFGKALFGPSWLSVLICIVVTFVLSGLSYRWIEEPAMHSGFIRNLAMPGGSRFFTKDLLLPVSVVVILMALVVLQYRGPQWLKDSSELTNPVRATTVTLSAAPTLPELREMVRRAANAGTWPTNLSPTLDTLGSRAQSEAMLAERPGCRNNVSQLAEPLVCEYGRADSGRTAMIVGDSIALSWVPAIQSAYPESDWRTVALGYASCPLFDVQAQVNRGDSNFQHRCEASRDRMWAVVRNVQPDVLILSAAEGYLGLMASGTTGEAAANEWQEGVERTLHVAQGYAGSIVVLGNPPAGLDPKDCASRLQGPASCLSGQSAMHQAKAEAERQATLSFAGTSDGARYIDASQFFCVDGTCPAFIGTTAVRTDATHLTTEAGVLVSVALRQLLPQ